MSDSQHSELKKHRRFIISRLFIVQLTIISIIAVTLGITGITLCRQHIYENVSSSCITISEFIENYCTSSVNNMSKSSMDIISSDKLIKRTIDEAADASNVSIFLFDKNGNCIVCSEDSDITASEAKLSVSLIKDIRKGSKILSDTNGMLRLNNKPSVMSKGTQFYINELDGSATEYFMLINTYTNELEHFIRVTVIVCFAVALITLTYYMFFIRRFTEKHIANPEADMSRVIRKYAQGDYSEVLNPDDFNSLYYQENISSLNQIISNLKTTGEQQSQFISNVSHELRTPMTIISGYVNGILDGTVPKEKRTEYLYIVSQEMQRLKILVSSMLNLTKYDNGTIQINRKLFSINDLIFKTFLMFENRLEKRKIQIEGLDSDTLYVYGDEDLIGQVVYNLTENAVKFVNTGGTISISLKDTKDASVFAIRNTGPGIPKDELPKIFGRFYKSDFSRSQDKTGLGLGLDIIRKILRLHNAQISVSSEENVFTEFSVSFPKKSEEQD